MEGREESGEKEKKTGRERKEKEGKGGSESEEGLRGKREKKPGGEGRESWREEGRGEAGYEMDLLSKLPVPGPTLDTGMEGKGMINRKRKKKQKHPVCSLAGDDSFTQENTTRVQGSRRSGPSTKQAHPANTLMKTVTPVLTYL